MLELVGDFFGRKKECVVAGISGGEPPWAHEAGGRAQGGGRALDPHGQVLAPTVVFSVPDILKYSKKNHISFSGHLENFIFGVFFIARINQKTDRKYYFCFISLNNRK